MRTGRVVVKAGRFTHSLDAGLALWVPAGVDYQIHGEPGSVALPIMLPAVDLPEGLDRVVEIPVPEAWSDWLVFQFALSLGYLRGAAGTGTGLVGFISGSPYEALGARASAVRLAALPLPQSGAALEVARKLLRTPADDTELAVFAARFNIGVRTLQRQFAEETGLPFARWRTVARVTAAATYLDAGRDIGWTGRQVGYATPAGFTRAFREGTGVTPSGYRALFATRPEGGSVVADAPVRLVERVEELTACVPRERQSSPPQIPASASWSRVNDFHVVVWMFRGSARVESGGHSWRLRRGDVMWLPAGVRNEVELAAGSILLPLGSQPGSSPGAAPPTEILRAGGEAEDFLLHSMISNYSGLRPQIHDDAFVANLIRAAAQTSRPPASASAGVDTEDPVHAILAGVSADPAAKGTLADWGARLGLTGDTPQGLHEDFVGITGQTFPRWRSQLRMTLARRALQDGRSVAEVGRSLGYAHASGFTKVFQQAHGMSPRDYQRGGWRGSREGLIAP
ncbi:AraC family transcriptional regulator [Kocuria polaris]|nr:AraC family transcriptional regulator [Kocuria polaris]